jgi:hypothetical protein
VNHGWHPITVIADGFDGGSSHFPAQTPDNHLESVRIAVVALGIHVFVDICPGYSGSRAVQQELKQAPFKPSQIHALA